MRWSHQSYANRAYNLWDTVIFLSIYFSRLSIVDLYPFDQFGAQRFLYSIIKGPQPGYWYIGHRIKPSVYTLQILSHLLRYLSFPSWNFFELFNSETNSVRHIGMKCVWIEIHNKGCGFLGKNRICISPEPNSSKTSVSVRTLDRTFQSLSTKHNWQSRKSLNRSQKSCRAVTINFGASGMNATHNVMKFSPNHQWNRKYAL